MGRVNIYIRTILVSCTGCRRRISAYCLSLFSSSSYPRGVYTIKSSVREAEETVKRFLVVAFTPVENEMTALRARRRGSAGAIQRSESFISVVNQPRLHFSATHV